ncbi:MAG: hypothetical protein C4526_12885 [Nitrospiraceae bacterium]|nr:MAG: hypothetical protein C4526_12885 [Nitrospiraceae bacterium]
MANTVYRIRRSFQFKNSGQAKAFFEIAGIYGKGRVFGAVVLYEAALEFLVWRKLENLAVMVSECSLRDLDIYKMTSQAGFKAFKNAGP